MLKKLGVREIFEEIGKCTSEEQIFRLLSNYGRNIRFAQYIDFIFSDKVQPDYPGDLVLTPSEMPPDFEENSLYYQSRFLYIFDKNRNKHVTERIKLKVLKDIICSLSKEDGEFFISVISDKPNIPENLTFDVVNKFYPTLNLVNRRKPLKQSKKDKKVLSPPADK